MEYLDSAPQAVAYLKQALPKMLQYELPPHPVNYSLWYNYVSARSPELNNAMDQVLQAEGTVSHAQSMQLFRRYVLGPATKDQQKTVAKLQALAAALAGQLDASAHGSSVFDQQLDRSLQDLQNARDGEQLDRSIDALVDSIGALSAANRDFRQQIQQSQLRIEQLKSELLQTQRSADCDPLTRLNNRRAFDRELRRLLCETGGREPLCLIFCDVDRFKQFNDDYGHLMGDRVLRRVGELLMEQTPANAIAARFGGEEFAVILPQTKPEQAHALAEQLRHRIEQLRVKLKNSDRVLDNITASFGIAGALPGDTLDSLLERADQGLYAAKRAGRNRVCIETAAA